MTLTTVINRIAKALTKAMPSVRVVGKAVGSLLGTASRYHHTLLTLALGTVGFWLTRGLPGALHHLSTAIVVAMLVLVTRAAWLDMVSIAAERRIARKAVEAVRDHCDHSPGT